MKVKAVLLLALIVLIGFFLKFKDGEVIIDNFMVPDRVEIPYPAKYNFRQSINGCGPYSVAAVARILTNREVDIYTIEKEMPLRIKSGYSHPWGMKRQLERLGLKAKTYQLGNKSWGEKLNFLMAKLSQNEPVILMGNKNGYQHYITLLGYDAKQKEVYVYDSWHDKEVEGLTIDSNGELAGNMTMSFNDLEKFWKGGGVMGFYRWYAIVASQK